MHEGRGKDWHWLRSDGVEGASNIVDSREEIVVHCG